MVVVPAPSLTSAIDVAIRGLPGYKKFSDVDGACFIASRVHVDMFREQFPHAHIKDCDGTIARLTLTTSPIAQRARLGKAPGGALWEHQHRGLDIISSRNSYGEYYDMGTGKSAIIVQGICELFEAGIIERALVIGTTRGKQAFVDEQIPLWTPYGAQLAAGLYSSTSQRWRRTFDDAPQSACKTLVVGPGCFQSKTQTKAVYDWLRAANGRAAIFVDESQNFKTWSSLRMKNMRLMLSLFNRRFEFTGEPMPLGYIDLFSQFYVLDPRIIGHASEYSFKNAHCVIDPTFHNIIGYRNIGTLVRAIAPYCEFLSIDACLDMPERNYQTLHYDPPAEQKRIYQQLEDDLLITITNKATGEQEVERLAISAAAQLSLMAQVSSGFYYKNVDEEKEVVWITDERAKFTLDEAVGDAHKCVIWCRFHADMDMLEKAADAEGIKWVEFSGRLSTHDTEQSRKRFAYGDARLLIGTVEAGGESIDGLQVAQRTVYFSNTYNFGKRGQSERRTWRAGQKQPCWYIDIEGFPIDRVIRANHKAKRDMSSMLRTAVGREALADELRSK